MKKIKIKVVMLLLSMTFTGAIAQEAVVLSGGDASGGGGSSSYTLGQIGYTSNSDATGSSSEGVQQPYEIFSVGIEDNNDITLVMSVFPNPAKSVVNLSIENQALDNLSFQLYDVTGRLLIEQKIINAFTPLTLEAYAGGQYLLTVSGSKTKLKSFNIYKNN